jgi:hypothetical protein
MKKFLGFASVFTYQLQTMKRWIGESAPRLKFGNVFPPSFFPLSIVN